MISKAGLGLSVLMLGLGLVGATRAEEPAKTINAATISYYPPYAFKDLKSGELQGFDIDLFNALAEKTRRERQLERSQLAGSGKLGSAKDQAR
ncbi:transporter substrate-binding domain-containing protein [Bradyrhizobium sp. 183]|uniref:transporter substrate-binding domain-containing protein n=1 Tax=unclassified Bradyrhizobium TaxID=2631580 RepID=UPI0020000EAA|nr:MULTISPECIES: transporter substrate-binding domain-containing protein [unclassified Bradyrhizobium]UPJ79362.1 transporter substrate-binding domain-containing protein [Bradyrhizobium sp. 184]UPJ87156.1 transporter substrate-binding domain-containing protein [Bradyrhizobium sp. 183]